MDRYRSKIRKVSRCRPTVSNQTILATGQEFFFTKVAPVQNITELLLLGFLINIVPLNVYFILHYDIFFRKELLFECLYFGEYNILMFLSVFWLKNRPSLSMYATRVMEVEVIQNMYRCVQVLGVEKLVIRYVRTKWMTPNKCFGIFVVHWFVVY